MRNSGKNTLIAGGILVEHLMVAFQSVLEAKWRVVEREGNGGRVVGCLLKNE